MWNLIFYRTEKNMRLYLFVTIKSTHQESSVFIVNKKHYKTVSDIHRQPEYAVSVYTSTHLDQKYKSS